MLSVGNVFAHGFVADEVSRLERIGFSIRPGVSHYAGSQTMRFIDFERGPPLELIRVAKQKEYEDFVPKGMVPYSPGINLVLPKGSKKSLAEFQAEFADLEPFRLHVNYDGTSDTGKPGWNYLNFGVPLLPGIFVWLTELEEPRPVPKRVVKHANGARGLRGLWFDLDDRALAGLAKLVGERPVHGTLRIGGLSFWTKRVVQDAPTIRGKRFPILAVVLETNRLNFGKAGEDRLVRVSFHSQPAAQIQTGPLSWDIVMTATGTEHGTQEA